LLPMWLDSGPAKVQYTTYRITLIILVSYVNSSIILAVKPRWMYRPILCTVCLCDA